jgi:hypothetical protein
VTFSSRTVIVPLGAASGARGKAAYIHAGGAKPANEARLIPEIALLNDCKLYPAGTIALSAVRRLDLKPGGFAVTQWFGATSHPAYVSVSNAPEIYGLTPENSASAQLGLALAMLMHQCQSPARIAVATGELAAGGLDSALKDLPRDDVKVKPVGMLPQKFEAIGRLLIDYRGAALSSSLPFFFPQHTETGEETAVVYAEALTALAAVYQQQGVKLLPKPVATLREAVAELGLERPPSSRLDKALAALLIATPVLAGLGAAAQWQASRQLPLSFGTILLAGGERMATPARATPVAGGDMEVAPACKSRRGLPVYAVGDRLVMNVAAGGHHLAIAAVSERSGAKVFPPQTWRAASRPDGGVSVSLPIDPPADEGKLIVLVQRFRPFDTEALRARLAAAVDGKPPGERINAAVNSLVKEAPGYLDYSFLTVEGKPDCANQ